MRDYGTHAILICALVAAAPVLAQPYAITTIAGGVLPLPGTLAANASIGDPPRVAVDASGNVFFGSLHAVFEVNSSGALIRIAGTGRAGYSGDGGPALNAQLISPAGIAIDTSGNIYVSDLGTNSIRRISSNGNIATYAGNGTAGFSGDGGSATAAQLNSIFPISSGKPTTLTMGRSRVDSMIRWSAAAHPSSTTRCWKRSSQV